MTRSRKLALVSVCTAALAALACEESITPPGSGLITGSGFLNATSGTLDVSVDGQKVLNSVGSSLVGQLEFSGLAPGDHQVLVQPTGASGVGWLFTVTVTAGAKRNVIAYRLANSVVGARALEDTGAIVPAGKSKVRVVNLVPNSNIDIWRTQPDFQTAIRFQFPFPFDTVPGPYLQSDAGDWNVWITTTSDWNTRLHETGPIAIPSGEKRTIVVVDSAGTLRLRVLVD